MQDISDDTYHVQQKLHDTMLIQKEHCPGAKTTAGSYQLTQFLVLYYRNTSNNTYQT